MAAPPWLVWQIADSAFPIGGFAHSFGLEAACQLGEVTTASLPAFVRDVLAQAGRGSLPFVGAGHDAPQAITAIDERCDVFLRNVVANRASRVQGRAWLATVERAFPRPAVLELCAHARASLEAQHYAGLFGATLRHLDVDRPVAQRLFLFGVCRGAFSAAVRLGIVGTTEAQRLLDQSGVDLDRTLARCQGLSLDEVAQCAPLVDLWQASHDRLYSRLFQS